MPVLIIERDITKPELERMKAGFDEHALEHNIQPHEAIRYGYAAMNNENFIGCISGLTDYNWFHITDLWLEKEYRNQGLGKTLIEKLEARVLKAGIDKIYTWTAGYQAPPFYKKQGYEVFCELENYFPTGDSRVGLRKTLRVNV